MAADGGGCLSQVFTGMKDVCQGHAMIIQQIDSEAIHGKMRAAVVKQVPLQRGKHGCTVEAGSEFAPDVAQGFNRQARFFYGLGAVSDAFLKQALVLSQAFGNVLLGFYFLLPCLIQAIAKRYGQQYNLQGDKKLRCVADQEVAKQRPDLT